MNNITKEPTAIERLINQTREAGGFTAAEILLSKKGETLFHGAWGTYEEGEFAQPVRKNALYDIASLTKPLATALAILLLMEEGKLYLEQPIESILPEIPPSWKEITIKHLLIHTSGLPAWAPLYKAGNDEDAWDALLRLEPLSPPSSQVVYSCIGYIILAKVVQHLSEESLTEFCKQRIFNPLRLKRTTFNPNTQQTDIVPTQFCPWRQLRLQGIVHDENAYIFQGEGGNAGLFSTAAEINQLCQMLLNKGKAFGKDLLHPRTVELMFANQAPAGLPPRSIGWDIHGRDEVYSSCGNLIKPGAVGHLGFTGTSLWMERESQIVMIILTNRVYHSREENLPLIRDFRPKTHNLLIRSFT